jgi:hypothetical protein
MPFRQSISGMKTAFTWADYRLYAPRLDGPWAARMPVRKIVQLIRHALTVAGWAAIPSTETIIKKVFD